ncbi:uncharacterized protein [Physcomitrium patens]|nr:intraflagellar transport protein 43 homolog [Physcomitrium patens]XP_024400203.1 intraflagellar transport protein 43 homolog [Physcomitrium patens]|eukprot:XP_024400202.1 intraflagellar transport protein 43 homolog [Physcomitrella patens]
MCPMHTVKEMMRPTFRVGWDANELQDATSDAVSRIPRHGSWPASQVGGFATKDHSRHEMEEGAQDIPELNYKRNAFFESVGPPRVPLQRVPSMQELENNSLNMIPQMKDGNIDLRPLMSVLIPISQVAEEDVQWNSNTVLQEVQFEKDNYKKTTL